MKIIRFSNGGEVNFHAKFFNGVMAAVLFAGLQVLFLGVFAGAAEKPVRITADNLISQYQKNEAEADARFKGKLLEVKGIVFAVVKSSADTPYIALVTKESRLTIQCFFAKNDDAALARLGSGVEVNVIGSCEGKNKEGNVVLKKCALKAQVEKKREAVIGYYQLGNTYLGLGDFQSAIEDFDRAIEMDPKFAEAYWGRGKTYHELGNNQEALKDFARAIELDPRFPETYWDRGKIYNDLGNKQQSIEDWKLAAKLGHEGAQEFLRRNGIKW